MFTGIDLYNKHVITNSKNLYLLMFGMCLSDYPTKGTVVLHGHIKSKCTQVEEREENNKSIGMLRALFHSIHNKKNCPRLIGIAIAKMDITIKVK